MCGHGRLLRRHRTRKIRLFSTSIVPKDVSPLRRPSHRGPFGEKQSEGARDRHERARRQKVEWHGTDCDRRCQEKEIEGERTILCVYL